MNTKKVIILSAVLAFAIGLMPLAAQNSPAGALVTGNIFNRDLDLFMMPNFAPFVNYQRFFSFVQGSMANGNPGFSAGYATNVRGTFMHFFLNTDGFSFNNREQTTQSAAGTVDDITRTRNFNLQFDTLIGTPDLGAFKLGLLFNDFGQTTTESVDSSQTTRSGFFTSSIAYGRNFINDDFSMLLAGGTVRFRLPMFEDTTRTTAGGITTTTTSRMRPDIPLAPHLQFPGLYPDTSMRLEVEPQMWYFFRPRLEPMVVISHIYLLNTFIMQFWPDEIHTTQRAGVPNDGFVRQERAYIGNTLFGYYNRLYVITPRFSLAWRINFTFGFFRNFEGRTYTRELGNEQGLYGNVTSREVLYFAAVVSPRLAFSYQIIPAMLTLNGGLIFNPLGVTQSLGWQQYRITTTYENGDVTTAIENHFNPLRPFINMGAAWYINPHIVLESGITINTMGGPGRHLDNISLAIVYRR